MVKVSRGLGSRGQIWRDNIVASARDIATRRRASRGAYPPFESAPTTLANQLDNHAISPGGSDGVEREGWTYVEVIVDVAIAIATLKMCRNSQIDRKSALAIKYMLVV